MLVKHLFRTWRLAIGLVLLAPSLSALAESCRDVPNRLKVMRDADQSVRGLLDMKNISAADINRMKLVDSTNTRRLKQIIATCGWPRFSQYGEHTARTAWLIAQHADADRTFQLRVLKILKPLVDRKEASPEDLAYVTDRTQLARKLPQLYGTQTRLENGEFVLDRVDSIEAVNARRAALGFEPVDDYLQRLRAFFSQQKAEAPPAAANP